MKLREVLDPIYGEPLPPNMDPLNVWTEFAFTGYGYGLGAGRLIVATTNGTTMRLHDVERETRSPAVDRSVPGADRARALLATIDDWELEPDGWGANPFDLGELVQRERGRR